jgi:alkane 1-monooxygenase
MALYLAIVLDWAIFLKMTFWLQNFIITPLSLLELVGIIFIGASLATAQFAVSHEVMHRPGQLYRVVATVHMSMNYYCHFTYQHLYGHHRAVATPEDPSTARKG